MESITKHFLVTSPVSSDTGDELEKEIILKIRFLYITHYSHSIVFCGEGVRIYKGKEGSAKFFSLEAVVTIGVTENSVAIKVLHERDLMVYQECPPILCERLFFSF